jgi:hypothetical protein
MPPAEYETWHLHDADRAGPAPRLKVRHRNRSEVPSWRDGPDIAEALERAAAKGWLEYDREPGNARGEYATLHLVRGGPPARPVDGV